MKRLGFTLITIGFILAAYVAVLHHTQIDWTLFTPAALIGVLGVVIARRGHRVEIGHADVIAANIEDIDRSLSALVANAAALDRDKTSIHTYDMRHRIDELLREDLATFADARETIAVKYGLQDYAEVMSHFATGERYVNRVWSCSADGYVDEVNEYIGRAHAELEAALSMFRGLRERD